MANTDAPVSTLCDPLNEILKQGPVPEVAEALRAGIETVVCRWSDVARQQLPHAGRLTFEHLRDHLPQGLSGVAYAIERQGDGEAIRQMEEPAADVARARLIQDWDLTEVILEYRLVRQIAVEVVEEGLRAHLTRHQFLVLDAGIDALLQKTVRTYVEDMQARQRQLLDTESRFLAYMSHDMRNNLNGVTLSLQTLRQELEDKAGFAGAVDDLDAAQQAIGATVEGMERMLQAERARHREGAKLRPVDVCAIESDVSRRFVDAASAKGLRLDIECPPQPVVLESDPDLLSIALQNLIGNAVKFSQHGTVRVGAHWQGIPAASDCLITVSDEGPGIPPDRQQDLFKAFERGPAHATQAGGTGLGLAIAAQAVRTLGGHLTLHSLPGAGTTFQFILHPGSHA